MNVSAGNTTSNMSYGAVNEISTTSRNFELTFFTTIGVLSVIANLCVIIAYILRRDQKSLFTKVCLHLCIINIVSSISIVIMTGQGDTWILKQNYCRVYLSLQTFTQTISIAFICFVTIETFVQHYKNVNMEAYSINNENCLQLGMTLTLIWCGAAVLSFITYGVTKITETSLCLAYHHSNNEFVLAQLSCVFLIPLLVMIVLNISFRKTSIDHIRSIGVMDGIKRSKSLCRDQHHAQCAFRIFQTLLITCVPYLIQMYSIVGMHMKTIYFHETTYKVLKAFQWWYYTSYFIQPILIIKLNVDIHETLKQKWREIFPTKLPVDEEMTSSDTEMYRDCPTPVMSSRVADFYRVTLNENNIDIAEV